MKAAVKTVKVVKALETLRDSLGNSSLARLIPASMLVGESRVLSEYDNGEGYSGWVRIYCNERGVILATSNTTPCGYDDYTIFAGKKQTKEHHVFS